MAFSNVKFLEGFVVKSVFFFVRQINFTSKICHLLVALVFKRLIQLSTWTLRIISRESVWQKRLPNCSFFDVVLNVFTFLNVSAIHWWKKLILEKEVESCSGARDIKNGSNAVLVWKTSLSSEKWKEHIWKVMYRKLANIRAITKLKDLINNSSNSYHPFLQVFCKMNSSKKTMI